MKKAKLKRLTRRMLHGLRQFFFLIPAAIAILFYLILPHFPRFTETVFSTWIFRLIAVPLGFLISLIPISLTETALVLSFPLVAFLLVLLIKRLKRSGNRPHTLGRAGKTAGWVLSSVMLLYMLMHGVNFYRLPAAKLMKLDTPPKSAEQLQALCIDLAKRASLERKNLKEDGSGCATLSQGIDQTLAKAGDGYRPLERQYPFLWGAVSKAKPVQLSHWWSYTGISGMYFPMLAESNVNIDQPDSAIPATAAHELAHTRGVARDNECNFFACLSCFESPSADYRYSGYLMAYIYCGNQLYSYDKDMWAASRAYCSDGVIRDLEERGRYWKAFEGGVQKVSEKVNDSFIKSQGVDDGVLSYDRVTELLLAYYAKEGLPG